MFHTNISLLRVLVGSCLFTGLASAQNCPPFWDFTTGLHDPGLSATAPGEPRDGTELESVNALVSFDSGNGPELYAGGKFLWAGGNPIGGNIAKWDGSVWSNVFLGIDPTGEVRDMLTWDDGTGEAIYVSGVFSFVGVIVPAKGIAKWDGTQWSTVGPNNDLSFDGGDMVIFDDGNGEKLYVIATVIDQQNNFTRGIYRLDGNTWTQVGQSFLRGATSLLTYDDGTGEKLYSTSQFLSGDPGPIEEPMRVLEDGLWVPFGTATMSGAITANYVWDDGTGAAIYASGPFWAVDNPITPDFTGLGKWDGTSWTSVDGGFDPGFGHTRSFMAWDDGNGEALYISGAYGTLKWNGQAFEETFGPGASINPFSAGAPTVMLPFDDGNGAGLFFGGDFESIFALDQNNIAINNFAMQVGVFRMVDVNDCNDGLVVLNESDTLPAGDGAIGDEFGNAMDMDDGILAVGSYKDDDNGEDSGAVYLFDVSTGTQLAKLLPDDGAAGDQFGYAVAIDNGVVAIGARYDNDNGSLSGSAYLFDASTGNQLAKLLPNDGAAEDLFGFSIAIDGGIVVVGSRLDDDLGNFSGGAYLFDAATGQQTNKLLPDDGEGGDEFGFSVAIDNGVVAVGSVWDSTVHGGSTGSAYLFDASTGNQIVKLLAEDSGFSDRFGASIAIGGGNVAVGAVWNDDRGDASGSVYIFDASTGELQYKILPSDNGVTNWLGFSVAIDNDIVVMGAPRDDDNGEASGSAYMFEVSTGDLIAKLLPTDGGMNELFGQSVAIKDGVAAVGATGGDLNGALSGTAYLFNSTAPACPADLTGDGDLNFFDVSAFLSAFSSGDPVADFTGDGEFNFFDVSAFLAALSAGCP